MGVESTSFSTLLANAEDGLLQLPEFQRAWKWGTRNVIELYDSVRQGFPIGSFLFMDRNDDVAITPRPFFANTPNAIEPVDNARFVLDGQQRLTAGLILFYGRGQRRYYLDLQFLFEHFGKRFPQELAAVNSDDLSQQTAAARTRFLTELDSDDEYCTPRSPSANPQTLLLKSHLLDVGLLRPGSEALDIEMSKYKKNHVDRARFVDFVLKDSFSLKSSLIVPVTIVERDRPVEAICRIFATLNTTGRPLTPFELVVSLLYPHDIRLRDDLTAFQAKSTYYANMDSTGEVLLQTIALLAKDDPKKARLPKTITHERYLDHKDKAFDVLEDLGQFLSARLGVGLNRTSTLIPYDSMFAPMAVALDDLQTSLNGKARSDAEQKLERWFVLAALDRRYQEGIHNKQREDPKAFRTWAIENGEPPAWIKAFRTPSLQADSGAGARPSLLKCLINRNSPQDVMSGDPVGFREHAEPTAIHHFFPIGYCRDTLGADRGDFALNLLLTSVETNATWSMSNPHDQLEQAIASRGEHFVRAELEKQFVDKAAFEILRKPSKTASDFQMFLSLREKRIAKELLQWGAGDSAADEDGVAEDETQQVRPEPHHPRRHANSRTKSYAENRSNPSVSRPCPASQDSMKSLATARHSMSTSFHGSSPCRPPLALP